MFYYHGNKHYYLTNIFKNDQDLRETMYSNGLVGDFESFAYALADGLYEIIEKYLIDSNLSATQYYDQELATYRSNASYISPIFSAIQNAIYSTYGVSYPWYQMGKEDMYVKVLKVVLYGSIKHFFFENKEKYLPQYEWYLINQNDKRKAIIDMLFKEFDKLTNVADALHYYQDPDDIPLPFLVYLQEITGLTTNTYSGTFTEKQLRSLTKHLIEVWRTKGSIFSIELFFACMGINCTVQELWFDRRLFNNSEGINNFTHVQSLQSFGYYLTPNRPNTVSYGFSSEAVDNSMYVAPRSSRIWDYEINKSTDPDIKNTIRNLLENEGYSFFKSNYLLINFQYINSEKEVSQTELEVFKELTDLMLPVFIRAYYGNEYEITYGNDDWDILKSWDLTNHDATPYVYDQVSQKNRPAELFRLFDVETYTTDIENPDYVIGSLNELHSKYYLLHDSYPAMYVGNKFVSGTYMIVYDTRLSQYVSHESGYNSNLDELVSSSEHDVIGGEPTSSSITNYPVYYNDNYNYKFREDGKLVQLDDTDSETDDNTVGELEIVTIENPLSSRNDYLTEYYFKVNDERTRIYPMLFADDNNHCFMFKQEGLYYGDAYQIEVFSDDLEHQVNWTYKEDEKTYPLEVFDEKYSDEPMNLFETSKWVDDINSYNNLYDKNEDEHEVWNGYIQYEYSEHTNPIESLDVNLKSDITITLI